MNERIWIASFWLMTLVGCASLGGDDSKPVVITSSNVNRLFDKAWELKQLTMDNSRVIMHVDAQMTLAFAQGGQVTGFASVNQFGGPYVFSETSWR